jgi:hypothetical protein
MLSPERLLHRRGSTATALFAAGGLLAGSAVVGLLPTIAGASSHREAPLIAADPAVDNTDVYAFSSPKNSDDVVFVANWIPFEEPGGGPNFYPWADDAEYLVNIDNNGDALADIIYRWRFTTDDQRDSETFLYNTGPVDSLTDPDLKFRQSFTLDVSTDGGASYGDPIATGPVAPSYTGHASMGSAQDYIDNLRTPAITDTAGGGRTLATQADDSFFLDLRVFDLLYGGDLSETGHDGLAGYNVNSIVLEVPKAEVAIGNDPAANPVVGVWSTTTRPTLRNADGSSADSGFTQVSRLGQPLVNEAVVPAGLKDAFNAISPDQDATAADGAVVDRVLDPELAQLLNSIYGIPVPAPPRYDIFEVFLTGVVSNATVDVDGDPATDNPIDVDLNSQALNAGAATFQPSEMLRLNMSVTGPTGLDMKPLEKASRLGVIGGDIQGFPNGRRLGDDVVDIELLALAGAYDANNLGTAAPLANGDGVARNDHDFSDEFPYLAGPNTESVNQADGSGGNAGHGAAIVPGGSGISGGVARTLVPALTGGAALLLLGAGAAALVRTRSGIRRPNPVPEV